MTLAQFLFKNRSYTPIPFLVVMLVFAHPTAGSLLAGFLVAACGELLRGSGVLYVGSETRVTGTVGASRLVTSGPFGYLRNPLYVGNILIYTGIGIMSAALPPWLQIAGFAYFLFQYSVIVADEERFLRDRFGGEYAEYCRQVPRFLPRFTPYRSPRPSRLDWAAGWKSEARSLQAFALVIALLLLISFLR